MEADARSIYVGNVCTRALIGVGGSLSLGDYLIGVLMETLSRIGGGFKEWREG